MTKDHSADVLSEMSSKLEDMSDAELLQFLQQPDSGDFRKILPSEQVELPRLTAETGKKVLLTLHGLSYKKVQEIQEMESSAIPVALILAGCPFFSNTKLLDVEKDIATPEDVVKAKLTAGEIESLSIEIQKLSGYRRVVLNVVKNG